MGWFRNRKDYVISAPFKLPPEVKPKGFQVGDRVIVIRNPNDDADTVLDFESVYGRMGVIAEKPCKDDESYDYTVKFDGWDDGWHINAPNKSGSYWGVYHKNLRRVSKRDERGN